MIDALYLIPDCNRSNTVSNLSNLIEVNMVACMHIFEVVFEKLECPLLCGRQPFASIKFTMNFRLVPRRTLALIILIMIWSEDIRFDFNTLNIDGIGMAMDVTKNSCAQSNNVTSMNIKQKCHISFSLFVCSSISLSYVAGVLCLSKPIALKVLTIKKVQPFLINFSTTLTVAVAKWVRRKLHKKKAVVQRHAACVITHFFVFIRVLN